MRRSGSLVRVLAALAVLGGWVVPLALPHAAGDDPICVTGLAGSDTPGALEEHSASSAAEHCSVCHLARSFRSALTSGQRVALWLAAGHVVAIWSDVFHRAPDADRISARAPPATSPLL